MVEGQQQTKNLMNRIKNHTVTVSMQLAGFCLQRTALTLFDVGFF